MKAQRIFKSLAELPADAWALAATLPGRAARTSRTLAGPPVRLAQRTLTAAGRQSRRAAAGIYDGAKSAWRLTQPWSRGGLNE
jgi:hypothetical protein